MRNRTMSVVLAAALCGPFAVATAQTVTNAPPPNYSASMQGLLDAAQRLREAIQAMAAQSAGTERNQAMRSAQEALWDAQAAMMALPPELRAGAGSTAENPTKAMERLQQAADQLRKSVQAMAQQPAGERRNQAASEAREALLETQQAMTGLL